MPFKSDGCDGIVNMNKQYYRENLPMYINGNLTKKELADFERELANDIVLKEEAEFLSAIRRYVKKEQIQTPGDMGLFKLKREIKQQQESASINNKLTRKWRMFTVAASLMLFIQAGVMITMTQQEDSFTLLSGSNYSESVMQVQFKNDARQSDINTLLISVNGSIIEGPSKKGIYRIQFDKIDASIIEQLQQQSNVIDFVTEE